MKSIKFGMLSAFVAFLLCGFMVSQAAADGPSCGECEVTATLTGVSIDNGTSISTIAIESNDRCPDLSNVVFGVGFDQGVDLDGTKNNFSGNVDVNFDETKMQATEKGSLLLFPVVGNAGTADQLSTGTVGFSAKMGDCNNTGLIAGFDPQFETQCVVAVQFEGNNGPSINGDGDGDGDGDSVQATVNFIGGVVNTGGPAFPVQVNVDVLCDGALVQSEVATASEGDQTAATDSTMDGSFSYQGRANGISSGEGFIVSGTVYLNCVNPFGCPGGVLSSTLNGTGDQCSVMLDLQLPDDQGCSSTHYFDLNGQDICERNDT